MNAVASLPAFILLWDSDRCIKRYWALFIPGYCNYHRNLLFSYPLDIYYFQAALPVKYSVLCFSYFMDTNTISYYNWLCYNKPNKVISKRINIIMHKSDSFENLAVRSTLNNILVLPASLSHNLGFRYRPHDQVVTVHLSLIRCLRTFSCPNSLHYFLCHIYKKSVV